MFSLPREYTGHSKHPLPTTQEKTTYGHHQMVNTKIRLIIFFAVKDGKAVYIQQKWDWELTVAQIMSSLFANSDLNWRKHLNSNNVNPGLFIISTYYHLLSLYSLFLRCVALVIFMCSLSHDEITYVSLFGLCTT